MEKECPLCRGRMILERDDFVLSKRDKLGALLYVCEICGFIGMFQKEIEEESL